MKRGTLVSVLFYGVQHFATVLRDQTSAVVLVRFDGETKERWFFAASLKEVGG
jgi:hypothetical protein